MYCNNCGNKLMGSERYCPNCGHVIQDNVKDVYDNSTRSTEGSRSASIVLGGLSLGGVFFGIFAPISLILSSVGLFLSFLITIFIILILNIIVNTSSGIYDEYIDRFGNIYSEHRGDF